MENESVTNKKTTRKKKTTTKNSQEIPIENEEMSPSEVEPVVKKSIEKAKKTKKSTKKTTHSKKSTKKALESEVIPKETTLIPNEDKKDHIEKKPDDVKESDTILEKSETIEKEKSKKISRKKTTTAKKTTKPPKKQDQEIEKKEESIQEEKVKELPVQKKEDNIPEEIKKEENSEPLTKPPARIEEQSDSLDLRVTRFPDYLMKRMDKIAAGIIKMSLFELNKLNAHKLNKFINELAANKNFFDPQYSAEADLYNHMDKLIKYLESRLKVEEEKDAKEMFKKIFIEPFCKKKFEKIIKKFQPDYANIAWEIVDKLGRKIKDFPYNEGVLRKWIETYLAENMGKAQ